MNEAVSEGEMGFSAQKSVECTAVVVIFNQPRKHVASYRKYSRLLSLLSCIIAIEKPNRAVLAAVQLLCLQLACQGICPPWPLRLSHASTQCLRVCTVNTTQHNTTQHNTQYTQAGQTTASHSAQ